MIASSCHLDIFGGPRGTDMSNEERAMSQNSMTDAAIVVEDPAAAVVEWFEKMSRFCSTMDYSSAREIFDEEVASFGTYADAVSGLDVLQQQQWEQVWPRTTGFRVLMETIRSGGVGEIAWGMAIWSSTGYDEAGAEFDRPGRATVVLEKSDGRWKAIHTHFSLLRATNRESHGPRT
jgi:ketosteroid isomerase-like protein